MSDRHHAEQFVAECIIKCVQVILHARVSNPGAPQATGAPQRNAALAKPNRWFQLEVEELPEVRPFLEQPCRADPTKVVEVEVFCGPAGRPEVVLVERWKIALDSSWPLRPNASPTPHPRLVNSGSSSSGGSAGGRLVGEDGALYKRLRQSISAWRMSCRVVREGAVLGGPPSSAIPSSPAPGQELTCRWNMAPVGALGGGLKLVVDHISQAAVSGLEELVAGTPVLPAAPRIIVHDYLSRTAAAAAAAAGAPPSSTPPGRSTTSASTLMATPGTAQPRAAHTGYTPQQPLVVGSLPNPGFMHPSVGSAAGRHATPDQQASRGGSQGSVIPASAAALQRNTSAHVSGGVLISSSVTHAPSPIASSPIVRKAWGKRLTAAYPPGMDVASLVMQGSQVVSARDARDAHDAAATPPPPGQAVMPPQASPLPGTPGAARTVSTPSEVMSDGGAAAAAGGGDGLGPLNKGPSAPVLIPGSQMRVRSFADMHVVYNFPDNPSSGASGTPLVIGRDPSLGTATAKLGSSACASSLPMHTHGSAPAAPRGMLGQALEAHVARLKATSQATTASPTPSPHTEPGGHAAAQPAGGIAGCAGHRTGDEAGAAHGGPRPSSAAVNTGKAGSDGKAASGGSLAADASPQGSDAPPGGLPVPLHSTQVPVPSVAGQARRVDGWPAGCVSAASTSAGVPDSPQLPFAFTPCAQSLAMSNPAHSHLHGRYHASTSVAASPSWNSLRTPNTMSQAWPGSMKGAPGTSGGTAGGGLPGQVSSTIISGRDVSSLALARRPSWIEHSARVGRSNSNSGSTSPAGDTHSLGSARRGGPPGLGSSLGLTPPGVRAVPSTPSRGSGFPLQHGSRVQGLSPPGAPTNKATDVWHGGIGAASWLQAPQISRALTAGRDTGVAGDTARQLASSSMWAGSPVDLPPPWLIAVPTDASPAEVVKMDGAADGDDLPFLIELGNQESAALPDAAGMPSHTSWVETLKHVCASRAQAAGGVEGQGSMCSPGGGGRVPSTLDSPGAGEGSLWTTSLASPVHHAGVHPDLATTPGHVLHLPDRDVAVGLLLAHMHSPSVQSLMSAASSTTSQELQQEQPDVAAAQVASSELPLTCSAALEQLSELHSRLATLLSPAA